jgi:DNA-binding NarL/FixJ family response regulator
VVIAEDSVLLLAGLTKLLDSAGFEVAATAGDGEELLAAVERERPDVVIADVRMPPTHTDEGVRAALIIRERWPDIAILVLSQYVEERYAADLLSANTRGVGYLLKDRVADVAEFLDALRRVAAGGTALDPEVVAQLLVRRGGDPLADLTQRELDVLALMAEGRSNTEIAATLVITDSAVSKHINSIFAKLGLYPGDIGHRRVLAVLRYLGDGPRPAPPKSLAPGGGVQRGRERRVARGCPGAPGHRHAGPRLPAQGPGLRRGALHRDLTNAGIAARLFITEKAVSKHINNVFTKLDLYPAEDGNRRVRAVLTYLNA